MSLANSLIKPPTINGSGAVVSRVSAFEDFLPNDFIQMYIGSSSSQVPRRLLAADGISSVNLKLKGLSRGFYAKHQRIVAGPCASEESLHDGLPSSQPQTMQFVLGMSDLLFVSVATFSGKEYLFSVERAANHRVRDIKKRICERELPSSSDDVELVLAGTPLEDHCLINDLDKHRDFGAVGSCHLHLLVRKNARVHAKSGPGRTMELSVNATEIASLPSIQEVVDEECPAAVPLALPCSRTTSSETIQPTMLGNHPSLKVEGFRAMMRDVGTGLLEGHVPHLTSDGSGGTYLMSDASGASTVAVFKPMDEEPLAVNCPRGMAPSLDGEGLKRGTRVGEGAFREVAAYLLDHPLNEGDSEGYASVPPTTLVGCSASFFPRSGSPKSPLDDLEGKKVGSLQKFVQSFSNCEDMGPSRFPATEVHKIAVLDMRLANTDRNGANILVQRIDGPSGVKLIPIDHGYCIPDKFEDCTFEWLYWPQSKVPFAEETLEYISKLDANNDIAILKESGWSLNPACVRVLQAATMLLKKGASAGKTPFEIGSMMVRDDLDVPSLIESLVEEAELQAQRVGNQSFEARFEAVLDQLLF
ncbi:unnamed protein product [Closterium sp. NIES-53]